MNETFFGALEFSLIDGRILRERVMGNLKQGLVVVSVLLVSTWVPISRCAVARKEDVRYIKCQVCEMLTSELYRQVQQKQAQILPKNISEYQIIEITENICDLKKQEADWMLKIDIVEEGDRLELVEQDSEGQCNSECKTIESACQEVMEYFGTDVAYYIYKVKPRIDSLFAYLCKEVSGTKDLSGACRIKPPPLPKDRTPGEPFVPKSSKEAKVEKILKSTGLTNPFISDTV